MATSESDEDRVHSGGEQVLRLFLIGPSGAGKSAVGEKLSEMVGLPLIDTDHKIEERAGRSVAEIFEDLGEATFRSLESELILGIAKDKNSAIVATGGGLPIPDGMFDLLDGLGVCVFLKASTKRMWRRLQMDEGGLQRRPLLKSGGFEAYENLVTSRLTTYSRAPMILDTERLTTQRVCELLAQYVGLLGEGRTDLQASSAKESGFDLSFPDSDW